MHSEAPSALPAPPSPATVGIEPPLIDGVRPDRIVAPDSAQAVADLLAEAAEQSLTVAPVGGGTALGLGNVPDCLDLALSTRALSGIIDYEPMDLVASVGAGMPFRELRAVLAGHGQGIPLEAPHDDDATVGGLIATALAGPRRLGSGSLRDLLIGIAVAHPSGTVTKAGGMVVKNVTGFDLTRLYLGSLGTLGVIVSANFKVLPLPRSEATLLLHAPTMDAAFAAVRAIRASSLQPVALDVTRIEGNWTVAVRIEGREGTVSSSLARVRDLVALDGDTEADADSAAWWRRYVDQQSPNLTDENQIVLWCAVRPRDTEALITRTLSVIQQQSLSAQHLAASPGLGIVIARLHAPDAVSTTTLGSLQQALGTVAGTVRILGAPPEAKRSVDVWGKEPDTLDIMRGLKHQFDPHGVLNPGRFAGRI